VAFSRPQLEPRDRFLLLALGAAMFFDGYDVSVHTIALTQIRDTFGLSKGAASALFAIVFLGALPALAITRFADRYGRKQLLIYSIYGYTICSGLSALAPNTLTFGGAQFLQQAFIVAESAIVWTMAAEELPPDARGYGFGVLGMANALGFGLAAIIFGGLFDPLGVSWRWLYATAVPPLVIVSFLRRRLPESRRFVAAQQQGRLAERWHEIFRRSVRRWLVLVLVTTFLTQMVHQAFQFTIDFLETERGVSTTTANFMLVLAGLPGIPIMVFAGALSDRYGRRIVGCGFACASVLGAVGFYWLPGGVPVLLPCMSLALVGQLGAGPVLQTYTSELFPTALRSSASSWANLAGVLGRSGSLAIAAPLLAIFSQSTTATILGIGPIIAIILFATMFPDTHGRQLEEISGEDLAVDLAVNLADR